MARALRLADLLGGLSVVADLGFGLPPQEAMRTAIVSTALAGGWGWAAEAGRDGPSMSQMWRDPR